jgi:hypothetical protein
MTISRIFVAQLGPAKSGETRTLVGFSAGAGFTIRFAGGPYGSLFDRYVFLAPILPGAATWRPNAGGWVNIALPRLITIAYLGRVGIHVVRRIARHQLRGVRRSVARHHRQLFLSAVDEFRRRPPV